MRTNYYSVFFVGSFMRWPEKSRFNDESDISLGQEASDGTANGEKNKH
jgi:hypothetical protein